MIDRVNALRLRPWIATWTIGILLGGALLTVGSAESLAQGRPLRPTVAPGVTRPGVKPVRSRLRFRLGVRPSSFRVGGFSRAVKCPNSELLTAIVPPTRATEGTKKDPVPVDQTLAAHPTIWLHVPQGSGLKAKFTLQDADPKQPQLYSTQFNLGSQAGLVGIRVPNTVPALVVGRRYLWQVSVSCDQQNPDRNPRLGSWLERVDPNRIKPSSGFDPQALSRQLEQAAEADQSLILAELGIWQDALSILALQRKVSPKDPQIQQDWADLLNQNRLEPFLENAPILAIF